MQLNPKERALNPATLPASTVESADFQKLLHVLDGIKPQAKLWSVGRRNGYVLECQKAMRELGHLRTNGGLKGAHKGYEFIVEAVQRGERVANEANVSSDFQILSSQILVTFADLFEKFHIEDLVSMYSMSAPRAYIETRELQYASASEFYEAGDAIADNIDPDYADSPGECQVANSVKMQNSLIALNAVTKRLTASWSVQAEQDAGAMFGINIRGELSVAQANLISRAYQQDHLLAMVNDAGQGTTWNETPQGAYVNFEPNVWRNTLYSTAVVDIDTLMRQDAKVRQGSNVIAGDATQMARFQRFESFRSNAGNFTNVSAQTSPSQVVHGDGYLQTTPLATFKKLVEYDYMPANRLLVVHKDDSRPARIHAPLSYAATTDLGEFTDPETGCRRIGVMSRAAGHTALAPAIGLITIIPAA